MAKVQLTKWDPADHLETEKDMLLYLELAMEDPFPELIAAVLGDIARAKGAAHISDASVDDDRLQKAIQDATRLIPDVFPA
jgi:probable addiction module antidote protein